MVRRLLATGLFALVLAAPAAAQPRILWPGVTFDTGVQFTPNGPVAINILSGPRPGGTTTLAPSLSNDTLTGRETLTAIERRTAPQITSAGINGDFFAFATGLPSGVLMQDGQVMSPPSAYRASAGVTSDGTLDVRRVTLSGTWQGAGEKRTLNQFNKPLEGNGIALYTQVWGTATPPKPGAVSAILFPFPAATPNTDLQAPVVELRTGGAAVPIPPGGAVLVAVGAAAAALTAEAPVGQIVTTQLNLKPDWPDIVSAIGGGPQIVRDGAPIFRAGEIFTTSQLGPRAPRSAVGQFADGKMILVTVDGRQPGYSVGMTNFELAQALVRLGAVTGMALDSGGSATMAFDGALLNRPSEPERPISTALLFQYTGVFVQPAVAIVSPDGDGVADKQTLRYKIVRPSTVEVKLLRPDGTVGYQASVTRQPGRYAVPFPPVAPVHAVPSLSRCRRDLGRARPGPLDAHRHRHRRHRPALGDDAVVPRQHDDRLPRGQPEQALPAPAWSRRAHHLEADQDREGHRHDRDPQGRGPPDAREAELYRRGARRDLERPRPHAEGRQGRRLRRPRGGPESPRDDRPGP